MFLFVLITFLLDIVLILQGEILSYNNSLLNSLAVTY